MFSKLPKCILYIVISVILFFACGSEPPSQLNSSNSSNNLESISTISSNSVESASESSRKIGQDDVLQSLKSELFLAGHGGAGCEPKLKVEHLSNNNINISGIGYEPNISFPIGIYQQVEVYGRKFQLITQIITTTDDQGSLSTTVSADYPAGLFIAYIGLREGYIDCIWFR